MVIIIIEGDVMPRRTIVDEVKEKLSKYGLELDCYRPGYELLCRVIVRTSPSGAAEAVTGYMEPNELKAWADGFIKCKEGRVEQIRAQY